MESKINFVDLNLVDADSDLLDASQVVWENIPRVNYKNLDPNKITYLPIFIRTPFTIDAIWKKIPNDIYLLMQQSKIKPLISMVTEQWDLFNTYAWKKNKFNITPDFADIPYSKVIKNLTLRGIAEENITWLVPHVFNEAVQIRSLQEKGYSVKCRFVGFDFFMHQIAGHTKDYDTKDKKFDKSFACLCQSKRIAHHRLAMIYELQRRNLLDKGMVSCTRYENIVESKKSNWLDDGIDTDTYMNQFEDFAKNKKHFETLLPINFDTNLFSSENMGSVDISSNFRLKNYEVNRQINIIEDGGVIEQNTLLFNTSTGKTRPMRSKEEAHDYRYFPDPDLLPLKIDQADVIELEVSIPELPDDRKKRYVRDFNLSNYDASVLTADKSVSDFFDAVIKSNKSLKESSKMIVNWITSELFSLLNEKNIEIINSPITPQNMGKLVKLIIDNVISGKIAKDVLIEMFINKQNPEIIIEQKGLKQVTDSSEIENIVDEVLSENPKMVDQYLAGKDKLLGFFVGQSMKKSKGKANPKILNEILKKKLIKKN